MNILPKNKFSLLALAWFALAWYALLKESSNNAPPPFAHFDKVMHLALFFAQIWLLARSFIHEQKAVPYRVLAVFGITFAVCSEIAQAMFTQTRTGSIADVVADIVGMALALWLARKVSHA
ncbi:MAG: VanZ family protein [Neisseria sp.]|nr:VanZ family protein [Neisseria sp.]